jgi:regulator of protease activity HflC (stomatin/prohibitin superfamily)
MEEFNWLAYVVIAVAAVVLLVIFRKGRSTGLDQSVYEWQTGLVYRSGKFERLAGPGRHWLFFNRSLYTVPNTPQTLTVGAQEVLTADRLQVKLAGLFVYVITDPRKLFEDTGGDYASGLLTDLQLALREIAASRPLERLVDERRLLDAELLALVAARAEPRGVAVKSAAIRDIILGAETRRLYAEFERARLEGLAALERARGEQASLRSLANSARLLKGNPELMNLRLLHTLQGQPGKAAPTVVLGGGTGLMPVQAGEADGADQASN